MKANDKLAYELTSLRAYEPRAAERRGFTILEIIVVVAILTIVFGYAVGAGSNFYFNQALIGERDSLVGMLRSARNRALDNVNQLSHGVYVSTSTGRYIVFDGASYASRNQAYDLAFPKSGAVAASGPVEIVFAALDGTSNVSGTITLTASAGSANISVNSEGRISW